MKVGDLVTYKATSDLLSHEHKMMGIVVKVKHVDIPGDNGSIREFNDRSGQSMVVINWGWKNPPQRWNAIEYENRLKVVSDV